MLKIYKYNNLINFSAEIFMLNKNMARNGLNCWDLRLLSQGELIDAYHWQSTSEAQTQYKENDIVLVVGNWATRHKKRFQIIRSEIVSLYAANEERFNKEKTSLSPVIIRGDKGYGRSYDSKK